MDRNQNTHMSTKKETKTKSTAASKPASTTPKAKDLPTKKDAKGGGLELNHNETLVRDPSR